jgi:histone arginine demethylase JMJD6
MRKVFLGIAASVRKTFTDIFSARANTIGSLGTASDGSQWQAISKIITVLSGKAVANYVPQPADAGSEYPIAVINMPTQNNIITLEDTDIGSGVALWVQTSADWWMVSVDSAYNTIPAATNYTSAPATFSGMASYTMDTTYTSSEAGFTAADTYSAGVATYSILPSEYSSGITSYTAGVDTYTSSVDTYSSTPTFSSSTPFTSLQPFSSVQVFSSATPFSSAQNYFSQNNAYTSFANFTSGTVWSRFTSYNRAASSLYGTYTRRYTRRNTPLAFTASGWSAAFFSALGNTWTSAASYTSGRVYTSVVNGLIASQSWTSAAATFTAGTTTYTADPTTYTAGITAYTAGLDTYTSDTFYTVAPGGTFSSATAFTSTTPFSSATPYSSATTFSSATNYFADIVFSTLITYTAGTSYTSAVAYTSNVIPESFAYSAILRISQSVSDTVSEISSSIVSTAQTIKSIIVQTSGNQITAKAFSDVTPITQIGDDLIYNATGVIINTRYGISISKAEYTNSEIGSSVKIERG